MSPIVRLAYDTTHTGQPHGSADKAVEALPISVLLAVMVGVVAGGFGAAALDTNPGVPLLIAGAIVTVWGAVLTTRFVREHPVTKEA